jgi:hypothetical protein
MDRINKRTVGNVAAERALASRPNAQKFWVPPGFRNRSITEPSIFSVIGADEGNARLSATLLVSISESNAYQTSENCSPRRDRQQDRCSMFKISKKGALLCAVLPIGLLAAGCSSIDGIGYAGSHEVVAGNWTAATTDFNRDYRDNPDHPIAVFNMGAAYHHDGDVGKADNMFSEAVERGRKYEPDGTLEPAGSGVTVAEHACARLHRDNKLDPNCGDQIALEVPAPPPAPIAEATPEPAPAVEAQATAVPKQDRN